MASLLFSLPLVVADLRGNLPGVIPDGSVGSSPQTYTPDCLIAGHPGPGLKYSQSEENFESERIAISA